MGISFHLGGSSHFFLCFKTNRRRRKERERLRQIQREKEKKRKEAEKVKREAEAQRRADLAKRKLEGQEIVPGIFIGGRLAAQNYDWITSAMSSHNLTSILNCTPNVRNYFDIKENTIDTDDFPIQELEELAQQLERVSDNDEDVEKDEKIKIQAVKVEEKVMHDSVPDSDLKPEFSDPSTTQIDVNGIEAIDGQECSELKEEQREEDDFFTKLETLDDEAKLALLESIQLPGDEELNKNNKKGDEMDVEEEEKEDEAKKMLELHKQRLTVKYPEINLSYQRIPIEDDGRIDVTEWFEVASEFIKNARKRGESVLIHCREGRSRSVTMTVAYLIIGMNMTLNEAMDKVKSAILDENINFGFKGQLMTLDSRIHGSHSIDYTSRRRRNTTINNSYTDIVTESTRTSKRSKRTRKTKGDEEDMEYNATTQELAPPQKVKAVTRSSSANKISPKKEASPSSSNVDISSTIKSENVVIPSSDVSMDVTEHTPNATVAEKVVPDELDVVDIETTSVIELTTKAFTKPIESNAMNVDAKSTNEEKKLSGNPTNPSSKPKPFVSEAKSKKDTAKNSTPNGTPTKVSASKKKAIALPVQKNTLLNYFKKS
jgi:glutaredoxin